MEKKEKVIDENFDPKRCPGALADDWEYCSRDAEDSRFYYAPQGIIRAGNTVKIWSKCVLSDKGRAELVKKFPNNPGIEKVSYTLAGQEIDCSKNIWRLLYCTWYNPEGKVILSEDYYDDQFIEVVPDSDMDRLVKIICKEGEGRK